MHYTAYFAFTHDLVFSGGVDDIKKQKYFGFSSSEWDSLYDQTMESPYKPKVKGLGDCDNFDRYPEEDVKWYGEGTDKFGDTFVAF